MFGKRQLIDLFLLSISFGNSHYLTPNKASLEVFFYTQDLSTSAPPRLAATSTDTTFYCCLPQVRPRAAAAAAVSEPPVTMTWRCGRSAHVLPAEWPGRRKTSDRPWRKWALHSVKAAKLGVLVLISCI